MTNPTPRAASPLVVWAALLTLYLVWGSTYLGILFAIETMPPYVMGVLRFVLSGGVLLAWSVARHPRSWPSLREIRDAAIVGGILLGGAMGLVAVAQQTIPSGIAALLVALLPAWIVILSRIFVGEAISRPVGLGVITGLVGVAVLVGPWEASGGLEPMGLLAILASPVLWAAGSIYSAHRTAAPRDPVRGLGIQMLSGAGVMAVLALLVGDWARFDPSGVSTTSLLAVGYLAVIGSIVGYSCYIWLLRNAPLAKVSTYAYVNPVVAFVLGAWLAAEPVTPRTVVAAAIILFGVALIVTTRSRRAPAAAGDAQASPDSHSEAGERDLRSASRPDGEPPRAAASTASPPPTPTSPISGSSRSG